MKTRILLFSASLFTVAVLAQKVKYEVDEDSPYSHNFRASFIPFFADYNHNINVALGYGFESALLFKKIATFNVYLEKAYLDINAHESDIVSSTTTNALKKYSHLELGGSFHLMDKVKTKKITVVVFGNSSERGFIRPEGDVRKMLEVRGGIYRYSHMINADAQGYAGVDPEGEHGVVATDGTPFSEGNTLLSATGFYAGLASSSQSNLQIDVGGYGDRGFLVSKSWYADVILANPKIDDFKVAGVNYDVSGKGARGFNTTSLGMRIGYIYAMSKRNFGGLYFKNEIGLKPGISDRKFYWDMAMGISFNGLIKLLAARDN